MKKKLLFIGTIILLISSCSKDIKSISSEQQVILSNQYNQTWTPSEKDAHDTLIAIYPYLNNLNNQENIPDHFRNMENILNGFEQYYVQFIGKEIEGNKIIWCNFFKFPEDDWKDTIIIVKDGGHAYWQIEYDITNRDCQNLMINGEA